ncbi:hypothetical protein KP509_32G010000 [Ceratopteris richardii]|uniref:CRAL-TRIO domain-containing protein n=1 Tax=Ceratopteris richardii TaxID=49495 RepID=A0A8T2QQP2_CERRI|nr:hypothetical protein KP509_32G010000 [Ceratopteris richardii]
MYQISKSNYSALWDSAVAGDAKLTFSFKTLHQGFPDETLERFLKAREGNVSKASKMIMDCLQWRISNDIDNILSRLIEPKETYDAIRDSQLIGMTGYCRKGRPVFAIGVGMSGYDKAPVDKYVQSHIQINEYRDCVLLPQATKRMGFYVGTCLKILDMSNLKISALNRLKILTIISTVDDLNYPEKTDTYYIVNAPYIFSACWKVVKPLLQERTKRKIKVLQGCGKEELLEVMDPDVLPYFCRDEYKQSGSSKGSKNSSIVDCYSSSDPFHMELWNHIKQQSYSAFKCLGTTPQKSFHVEVPEPDEELHSIEYALETALVKLADDDAQIEPINGKMAKNLSGLSVSDD